MDGFDLGCELQSTKMKVVCYISILAIVLIGCKTEKCICPISNEELTKLNNSIRELKEVFGYEWTQKFKNTDHKTYRVEMDNWFTGYMKTYHMTHNSIGYYLQTILSKKQVVTYLLDRELTRLLKPLNILFMERCIRSSYNP